MPQTSPAEEWHDSQLPRNKLEINLTFEEESHYVSDDWWDFVKLTVPRRKCLHMKCSFFESLKRYFKVIKCTSIYLSINLSGQLPPITKTIQVRRTRHVGHSWRIKGDILLWTLSHGRANVGRPARPIYNSSVLIQDVAWKTSQEQWRIETGGERWSERSVLAARHDDEDDDVCGILLP